MATYIVLLNYTEQGIKNIKDSPNRLDAAKELARQLGGELKDFYLTMGTYDAVAVCQLPDDETAAKMVLAVGSRGAVRSTTLRAFAESEYRKIIQSLP
ncbi:MAG: GYD domain-containing protein [Kiloniellaceae bacterium]